MKDDNHTTHNDSLFLPSYSILTCCSLEKSPVATVRSLHDKDRKSLTISGINLCQQRDGAGGNRNSGTAK